MKQLPHIGTTELASLPDYQVFDVPVKIDTGADSSSIWASSIVDTGHELQFILFNRTSPFYSGQTVHATDYKVVSVKNSFGQSELRYKVPLKIRLAGRTIRATFTLANREKNRYPILIGRRTLHGKFLVDVSQKNTKQALDILMLSTNKTRITQQFADNLEQYGKKLRVTYAAYDELSYEFGTTGSRISLIENDRDIASFDLVHFKTTFIDIAAATARYLQKRNVPYLDRAVQYFPSVSKLYQYSILTDHNIAVPQSVFLFPVRLQGAYEALKQKLGLPFVLKDIHGSRGDFNFLITDEQSFKEACKTAEASEVQCIAQVFIPNDCDYRVLIFGAKISLAIKRARIDDSSHLNNTSQGGTASLVDPETLPPNVQTACIAAAKIMDRQVAGVDIIQDKITKLWYCLEVNERPQIATGSFTAEKHAAFAAYLERRLTK